ncbi:MAG: sensor histidine kinase [Anaerolineales bacterium]|nr:sensor histidine kinase [Anaerolineales bacterium]
MNITLVYFIYGLAFFSMGLAMLFESGRSPSLAEAGALRPLAVFGFIHGSHEWLEMFLDQSDWLVFEDPVFVGRLRVGILTASFLALMIFGMRMLWVRRSLQRREWIIWNIVLGIYIALMILGATIVWGAHQDRLGHLDASVRYLIATPGAWLAAIALLRQLPNGEFQRRKSLRAGLHSAALGFFLYGFTQLVVPPLDTFPANWLNTSTFLATMGFPVQAVRAGLAILITLSLIYVVNMLEKERQSQFLSAQQARMSALNQLHQELIQREVMRRELTRRIVLAQEEERARIARELHDETAQVLTAFMFHLAALRQSIPADTNVQKQYENLQRLSQRMSLGIYRLVRDLRPALLDDLGLASGLQYLAEDNKNSSELQVELNIRGKKRRLDKMVETVLYRIAQEALTNVVRHAETQQASIDLEFTEHEVILRVTDWGIGFDVSTVLSTPDSLGLAGMRERAESIGGQLIIDSAPGQGTRVEARIPIEKQNSIKMEKKHQSKAVEAAKMEGASW